MWISKTTRRELQDTRTELRNALTGNASMFGENRKLEVENARLRSDLDWFKHRLNQVEMERAMLIQDRIGVRINVPQFVPAMENPEETLNEMPDLSTVGGDAREDSTTDAEPTEGVNYSTMPGYKGTR